jgi:hypothetical protein
MRYPIEDPRRHRVFKDDVEPVNLEALAEVLNGYASRLDQAIEMYDGEEQFSKATEFNEKAARAYRAISEWQDEKPEDYPGDEFFDKDPAVLEQELLSADLTEARENIQRREEAKSELLEAERNYLDAVRKAEREIEWP